MSERGEGALGSTDETSQMTLPFEEEAAIDPFDNHLD